MEQMCTSQWLLTRLARSESRVHDVSMNYEARFALLDRISVQRTRLERSFTSAMRELERLQLKRQARPQPQPAPAAKAAPAPVHQPAEPNVQPPAYVMSESAGDQPVFCAAVTPGTR